MYEWPDGAKRGARLGQAQRWFFFEAWDDDVEPTPDGVEFDDWKWVKVPWLVDQVVEFRKSSYQRAAQRTLMSDLFAAAAEETRRVRAPLAARLRPKSIDDVVGQEHLVGPGSTAALPGRKRPIDVSAVVGSAGHR